MLLGSYRGYIGIMEKELETTIFYGIIEGLYRDNGRVGLGAV